MGDSRQSRAQETSPPSVSAFDATAAKVDSSSNDRGIPIQIGSYRPLRILGEGGMGVVYEAEQVRPKRVVALKVIRAVLMTPPLVRRFEFEAEVLGRLQHPGIAQIYEAGTADSGSGPQPFFAMELIRGPRLDRFVAEKHLSIDARIDLLIKLCDAVQYAHQRGVIHRDLKPGNILVDASAQPKILDFGVARMTNADLQAATLEPTSAGTLLGTLQYMAPEQARGDIHEVDAAADVYALGVIAYELFGGSPPYVLSKHSLAEAVRVICDSEPSRLSVINRDLRGDLETIVGKALAKEKSRRYLTAGDLAADLKRYQNHEPITARPPTLMYQVSKFTSRNRAFSVAVLATFIILFAFGITVAIMAVRISQEQQRTLVRKKQAEDAGAQSAAVNRFMWSVLKSANPAEAQGTDPTVRQALDAASKRVETELQDQPLVEAAVRYTIGDTYLALGRPQEAEPHLRRAMELQRANYGDNDRGAIVSQNLLTVVIRSLGRYQEAEPLARDALTRSRRILGEDHEDTVQAANDLAVLLTQMGKFDEAEVLQRDVLARQAKSFGPDHPKALYGIPPLSYVLTQQGKDAESEAMMRDALPRFRRTLGDDHPDTITAIQALAINLMRLNRLDEAEVLAREVYDRRRKVLGPDHPDTFETTNQLGVLLAKMGRPAEAETLQRAALAGRRKLFGDTHPATISSMGGLAQTLSAMPEKTAEAEALLQSALEQCRLVFGPQHPATLNMEARLKRIHATTRPTTRP